MARHTVHEGGLARARLTMQQVAAVVRDAVLGVEGPRLVLQEPLEVLHERPLHASQKPNGFKTKAWSSFHLLLFTSHTAI